MKASELTSQLLLDRVLDGFYRVVVDHTKRQIILAPGEVGDRPVPTAEFVARVRSLLQNGEARLAISEVLFSERRVAPGATALDVNVVVFPRSEEYDGISWTELEQLLRGDYKVSFCNEFATKLIES